MKENIFKGTLTAAFAALTAYLDVLLVPVSVLLITMVIDYVSGLTKAWVTSQLSSRIGIIGIIKKVSYLLIVCVGMIIDWIIGSALANAGVELPVNDIVALIVIVWLVINELLSIIENVAAVGVNVPKWLLKLIGRLKNTVDSKLEEAVEEEEKTE